MHGELRPLLSDPEWKQLWRFDQHYRALADGDDPPAVRSLVARGLVDEFRRRLPLYRINAIGRLVRRP